MEVSRFTMTTIRLSLAKLSRADEPRAVTLASILRPREPRLAPSVERLEVAKRLIGGHARPPVAAVRILCLCSPGAPS